MYEELLRQRDERRHNLREMSKAWQADVRQRVRDVLCAEGVSTICFVNYYCFGFEVDKLQRLGVDGEALAREVATLVAKWTSRGLSPAVLEAVRTQAFNVSAPTPPDADGQPRMDTDAHS